MRSYADGPNRNASERRRKRAAVYVMVASAACLSDVPMSCKNIPNMLSPFYVLGLPWMIHSRKIRDR